MDKTWENEAEFPEELENYQNRIFPNEGILMID